MVPKNLSKKLTTEQMDFMNSFFKNAPDTLFHRALLQTYSRNHTLIHSEDTCSNVYILLKGRLQAIEETVVNEPFSFTELPSIEIVGDFELFTQSTSRIITLTTLESSLCLVIPSGDYISWIKKDAEALHIRIQMLIRQLISQTKSTHHSLFLDNKMRLLHFIFSEYNKHKDHNLLLITYTRSEIASRLGCSLRTVNRNIADLNKEKLITLHHGKIQIEYHQFLQIEQVIHPL